MSRQRGGGGRREWVFDLQDKLRGDEGRTPTWTHHKTVVDDEDMGEQHFLGGKPGEYLGSIGVTPK
ncbi:MAG: hypothetical protein ABH851_09625 [Methanobacteriota archaeon]